ncbi:MAG TPA: hypothetical protein VGH19_12085 [Verrucomicrobiae bacterium]
MATNPQDPLAERLQEWERRVPGLLTGGSVLVLFWIVISAIGQGFIPQDDALRHAAYAVSGKTWDQILVLNPAMVADHNPGWHVLLKTLHAGLGWNQVMLVLFSVAFLFLCVTVPALFMVKRPELWLASLLAIIISQPHFIMRLTLGRPLLLSIAVLIFILLAWTRDDLGPGQQKLRLGWSVGLMGLAVWVHGTWYLFVLPALAFALAGRLQSAQRLALCWLGGSALAAVLTGHPVEFLSGAVRHALYSLGGQTYQHVLVSEFKATDGVFPIVALIAIVAVARTWLAGRLPAFFRDPIFVMVVLGWVLGLKVGRFWLDWGLPATWVWLTQSFIEMAGSRVPFQSLRRAKLGLCVLASLLFLCLNDYESRWTRSLKIDFISAEKQELEGWLPDDGGIIYSPEMTVFYHTFFKNPNANWRYALGYEPALMQPDDFKTLRNIQWNDGDPRTYQPWLDKLRPEDRLVFIGGIRMAPELPGIEWNYVATDRWIGRPVQKPAVSPVPPSPR